MALALRIDDWINDGAAIEVRYTYGVAPLQPGWSGFALRFTEGKPEMDALISRVEETCIQPDLMLGMLAARFRRQSANFTQTALIRGKMFEYDPDSQQTVKIN